MWWTLYGGLYIWWTLYTYMMDSTVWILYGGLYDGLYSVDLIWWTLQCGLYMVDSTVQTQHIS